MSIDGMVTTHGMYPDDFEMIYDAQWPKTPADFAKLLKMESFYLECITMIEKEVDGKDYTRGIQLKFHGETYPITYGE